MLRIIILFVCHLGPFLWGAENSVAEAWAYLIQPKSNRDDTAGVTEKDLRAVMTLRANKPEAERLVIAALRKGGRHENAESWAGQIFDRTELRRIARIVVRTYEVGDKSMPFIGFLTFFGEKEDMELLKQWIRFDPDCEGSVQQTALMAQSDNPCAHAALLELKREVPGKWQDSYYMKKFFVQERPANSAGGKASMKTKIEAVTESQHPVRLPQEPTLTTTDAVNIGAFVGRWWLLGGIAVIAAVAFIFLIRRLF